MRKGSKMTDEQKKKISKNHADMSGENNPMFGKKHDAAAKKKMSDVNRGENNPFYGKKHNETTLKKMSKAQKGKKISAVSRKKMSDAKIGKIASAATRAKMSESRMGEKSYNYKHGLSKTKEYSAYCSAKRRATKLNQTPDNANIDKIQLYYTICAYLNDGLETPAWHVDHIKPISKGGFHHEDNLQILTATINLEKHNKYPLTEEEEIKYKGLRIGEK